MAPTLPSLPAKGETNWYNKRAAFDAAVREFVEDHAEPVLRLAVGEPIPEGTSAKTIIVRTVE